MKEKTIKRMITSVAVIFFLLIGTNSLRAQNVALKTNLLYDATTTFNLGLEFSLAPKWTLDISANYNPWTFDDNKKFRHLYVQPEARYWFCQKMNGHFFAMHLHSGVYNVGNIDADFKFLGTNFAVLKEKRLEGWFVGAGIGYGYAWMLGKHWNLEAEIAIGYAYTKYGQYPCVKCSDKESNRVHNYVGPTKAALSLVYVF